MRRQLSERAPLIGRLLAPILLACVCGCGNTAKVNGKVTYQGRPVAYGSVILLSADNVARSGVIAPDGSYAIENAPRGTVKISVISRVPGKGRSGPPGRKPVSPGQKDAASEGAAAVGWFPLPAKFESPETSGLSCNVDSGHVYYDIDLK